MPAPIIPHTVSEQAAEPDAVDEPVKSVIEELPAERTTAPDVEDTGAQWSQRYPGESQGMPDADIVRLLASRVTQVSDIILFGSESLGVDADVFQLVPAHRDRLRVTIQVEQAAGEPDVYIGSDRNLGPANGWKVLTGYPLTFHTRDAIYCESVGGAGTVLVQWAAELVAESAVT